jgi:NAD(P)H-dependent FMN reductase
MNKVYDIAMIVGSLGNDSINHKLANVLAELAPAALKLSMIKRAVPFSCPLSA